MNYKELKQLFLEHEQNCPEAPLTAYITFSSFGPENQEEYSWESRTYVISSDNKAFQPTMGGYSIFGHCLDGKSDPCLRLDYYMSEERGGKNGWVVEECCIVGYLLTDCSDVTVPTSELFYEYSQAHKHMLAQLAQVGELDAACLEEACKGTMCASEEDFYRIQKDSAWLSDQSTMDCYWSIQPVRIYSLTRIVVGHE
jgi:hypothetical protein